MSVTQDFMTVNVPKSYALCNLSISMNQSFKLRNI